MGDTSVSGKGDDMTSHHTTPASSKLLDNSAANHDDSGADLSDSRIAAERTLMGAGGDGNRNSLSDKANVTKDFIGHESSVLSETSTGEKRKREESPDSYSILMDEDLQEESYGSDEMDSDLGDETSNSELVVRSLSEKQKEPEPDNDQKLPETVTVLSTPDGGKVYLVGTAHFSIESQEDVSKVIRAVQPHVVLVELCKARVNILQLDEKTILEEAKNINFAKMRSSIKENGVFQGLMYLLLLSMSAHLTRQLGTAPGGEFRRAFAEAKQVPMCMVHLGDRAIQVTLRRALASLSWWQTLRLSWHLLTSKDPISKEELERCKRRDLLEEMLAEMAGEFPALGMVFVTERDIYLTHSLQLVSQPQCTPQGVVPARVVGVVGMGHVPGIIQNWGKVQPRDIPPLLRLPPPSLSGRVLKFTMKVSLLGLALWGVSRLIPVPGLSAMRK